MNFVIDPIEAEAAFAPAVRRVVHADDREWAALEARNARHRPFAGWRHIFSRRGEDQVREIYERKWSEMDLLLHRLELSDGEGEPMVWSGRRYIAHSRGSKRVHLLYLMRLIESLRPNRVLEVGFGTGINLFILAARFPDVSFAGVELTEAGNLVGQGIRAQASLPGPMISFSPLPLKDLTAHQRVVLQQGSGARLPFEPGSFDLVFTIQALEQMQQVRREALMQLTAVSRGHVAMFEPFADWNSTPARKAKIAASGYFSVRVDELSPYGLQPILATDDMPSKLNYGIGLVVARTTQPASRGRSTSPISEY